jgi:hypothetical protein
MVMKTAKRSLAAERPTESIFVSLDIIIASQ